MIIWAAALLLGAVVGLLTGGALSNLVGVRLRAWPLLAVAVALEASLGAVRGWPRPVLAVTACLTVAAWCAVSCHDDRYRSTGQLVLGVGIALNAMVMALNAGMPVSRPALAAAGLPRSMDIARADLYKHTAMTGQTHLAVLGDTIPFHFAHTVLSPGDVLMLAGTAIVAFGATHGRATPGVRLAKSSSRTSR